MSISGLLSIIPAVLTAFVICFMIMPMIIRVAEIKHLIDQPDQERKFHGSLISSLGGIGIFAAFIISFSIWGGVNELSTYPYFVASLFLLFLVGIKDDLIALEPTQKLIVQFLAAIVLVAGGGLVVTDFGGIFGFHEIPWIAGVIFSVIVLVAIVNAFNLIDGIDGLAGGIGVIISSILGIWFWGVGFISLSVLAFTLAGALIGFLIFNMHPAKIFMGDTGAMAVGFILGYLALEYIILNSAIAGQPWHMENGHIFALALFVIPVTDTLRVIFIRSMNKKSILLADRNHIHHKLSDSGMSDPFVSFSLWLTNIFIVGAAYSLSYLNINFQLFLLIIAGIVLLPVLKFIHFAGLRIFFDRDKKKSKAAFDYR
jgi:UDP-GlcNAc:undecaprenyl-phosphate/decaprenyl-phosphate GlcNAc-1-phosphate transferase